MYLDVTNKMLKFAAKKSVDEILEFTYVSLIFKSFVYFPMISPYTKGISFCVDYLYLLRDFQSKLLCLRPLSLLQYVLVMQRFIEVYHGISHEPLVFSGYKHEPLGEFVCQEKTSVTKEEILYGLPRESVAYLFYTIAMGGLDVITSNIQRLYCILISCISYGMVYKLVFNLS